MMLALGNGYVGNAFRLYAGATVLSRATTGYDHPQYFPKILTAMRPQSVVNCAGFTGRPHIDECEVRRDETVKANIVLAANISRACADYGIPYVHISSGCIYQGSHNYAEDAQPAERLSFYSQTKWIAEQAVKGYVLRIRMPFDGSGHERCLLSKLAKYPRLIDCENSITFLPDVVYATCALLAKKAPIGVYHVTNEGVTRHSEIAALMGWQKEFIPLESLGTAAPRSNCTLNSAKLAQFYPMPHVLERLALAAKPRVAKVAA